MFKQVSQLKKHARTQVEIKKMLFPSCLFIQASADANLAVVKDAIGLTYLAHFADFFEPVKAIYLACRMVTYPISTTIPTTGQLVGECR